MPWCQCCIPTKKSLFVLRSLCKFRNRSIYRFNTDQHLEMLKMTSHFIQIMMGPIYQYRDWLNFKPFYTPWRKSATVASESLQQEENTTHYGNTRLGAGVRVESCFESNLVKYCFESNLVFTLVSGRILTPYPQCTVLGPWD
jgi:hypothetical protein